MQRSEGGRREKKIAKEGSAGSAETRQQGEGLDGRVFEYLHWEGI